MEDSDDRKPGRGRLHATIDNASRPDATAGSSEPTQHNDAQQHFVAHASKKPIERDAKQYLMITRIDGKDRPHAKPVSLRAPDWRLSRGTAVIVLGMATLVGTCITVTERDAMQGRLRYTGAHAGAHAGPLSSQDDTARNVDSMQEAEHRLRARIEAMRGADADADDAAPPTVPPTPAAAATTTTAALENNHTEQTVATATAQKTEPKPKRVKAITVATKKAKTKTAPPPARKVAVKPPPQPVHPTTPASPSPAPHVVDAPAVAAAHASRLLYRQH